jgi:uncharacterized damage-inducible protein DinB
MPSLIDNPPDKPMLRRLAVLASMSALPMFAQAQATNPNVANARILWTQVNGYIAQSAADVPEALYAYKPTPEVRSFGELLGHIAGSEKMFCAVALGEKQPAEDAVEKAAKTKAALIAALKDAATYCARAYNQTDKATEPLVDIFGEKRSRVFVLLENVTHDNEHYGNIVTYMRLNKMVPPSSKPSK